MQTVTDFYHDYAAAIEQLCREMPDICNPFAAMIGFWNPFRARFLDKTNPLPYGDTAVALREDGSAVAALFGGNSESHSDPTFFRIRELSNADL